MPWKTDDIKRLIELEASLRGIDPRLALALAEQESGFDPQARSPKGATGIFQLMPATARQLKVDPSDVPQNISGGLDYLKQQLDAFGGDPGMAVAAYNAGPGVVKAYGKVPPYKETRGLVSRVLSKLGPASAEAATPRQSASGAPWDDIFGAQAQPQAAPTPGRSRLQELEAHLARLEGQPVPQPPTTQPAPPTATSTPEQDAAYRASVGQKEPATAPQPAPRTRLEELEAELARRDAPQAPGGTPAGGWQADIFGKTPQATGAASAPAEEPITPERRFLDLPSSQQMSLEDRTQRFQEFYRLKPALKEEFLRSEEPPSDITVDIEKPSPPAPTGWRAQLPQTTEEWDKRMAPMRETTEATSRAAIPMALSAVPGGLAYTLGTRIAPALGAVGKVVPPLLEAAGGYAGHRANVALGHEKEGVLGDVLSALPLAVRALGSGTAGWLERTIKDAPVAARDATMDLLSKLFSRGGAQGTLTYLLSGDPQLAAWVGGSYATVRSLLGFALRSDIGKQLVETWLKAGRAIGGAELGMLLQIGKTGKFPEGWGGMTPPAPAQEKSPAP